jgi:hypothetical protein
VLNERTVVIRTHCKDCVFNMKVDGEQVNCKLDRLATFIEHGTKMERVDGSYVLEKLCIACRDQNWAKDKDDAIYSVNLELEPKIDYVVICEEDEPNLDKIKKSIASIRKQDIEPNKIVISVKNNGLNIHSRIYNEVDKNILVNQSVWSELDGLRNIDNCIKQCNGAFYVVIKAGDEINSHYSYIVNYLLNDRLQNFVMIEGMEDFPTLILSKIHTMLAGNKGGLIEEKIKALAKEQDSNMIKRWEDVINC